jgi:membrane associated rhomboid family serine protease
VILGAFGFIMQGVDNLAHIGGFVGGFLISMFLDPLEKENFRNMVTAAICLILTVLSVLVSVVTAYF